MPVTANATTIDVANSAQLASALASSASGDVIRLTANITYNGTISIDGKDLTFSLNGFSLTANSSSGYGLAVRNNAKVLLTGYSSTATFNVTGVLGGIRAYTGGQCTVSNATGPAR